MAGTRVAVKYEGESAIYRAAVNLRLTERAFFSPGDIRSRSRLWPRQLIPPGRSRRSEHLTLLPKKALGIHS